MFRGLLAFVWLPCFFLLLRSKVWSHAPGYAEWFSWSASVSLSAVWFSNVACLRCGLAPSCKSFWPHAVAVFAFLGWEDVLPLDLFCCSVYGADTIFRSLQFRVAPGVPMCHRSGEAWAVCLHARSQCFCQPQCGGGRRMLGGVAIGSC